MAEVHTRSPAAAGQLQSTITCSACRAESHCFDLFLDLSVPLPQPRGLRRSYGHAVSMEVGCISLCCASTVSMLHTAVSLEVDCSGADLTFTNKSSWAQPHCICSPRLHGGLWPPMPSAGVSGDLETWQLSMGHLRRLLAGLPA